MPTVSAVMITYNEAEFLPLTLPPLREVCDEVVVLDMDSTDDTAGICSRILRDTDLLVSYRRQNLFSFGFSHSRNYASRFCRSDWILAIDADELIIETELRDTVEQVGTYPVYSVERRNYAYTSTLELSRPGAILAEAEFDTERHRRLYRNDPRLRFEGLVHEELWDGDQNANSTCGMSPLTLHHLSTYRKINPDPGEKGALYAYLMLKAQIYPRFRYGTNPWYFQEYVPNHLEWMFDQANDFAARNGLNRFDWEMVSRAADRSALS